MAFENRVQSFIHRLEEGGWAKWIRFSVVVAFCAFMISLWLFRDNGFKGLSHAQAIDQAQVSREIARGNGFSTKFIRPAALWQFTENRGAFNVERTPETYHAPLNPLINAPFLWLVRNWWPVSLKDIIYKPDKVLVSVQFGFMLLGILMSYLTVQRLFDHRLAVLVAWLLLLCQTLWDYSISGLPQNLLLFLFSSAMYLLVRALEARAAGARAWPWLAACGATFGLLGLAHSLTVWAFAGALLFCVLTFKPRWLTTAAMLGAFLLLYTPWVARNWRATGNLGGVASYALLHQVKGTGSYVLRSMQPPLKDVSPWVYREKLQTQIMGQFERLYHHLGRILVAPVFFVALLHTFKRPEAALFRWAILLMWLAALVGMAAVGMDEPLPFSPAAPNVLANDINILFVPLMSAYGLAFLLVLWSRLELNVRLVRIAFIGVIFLISSAPFLIQFIELNSKPKQRLMWPPYVPLSIAKLNLMTTEREVIASDMPWAVAWYGDRKSLWLPLTIKDFEYLNDYNILNGRIIGLYLTPVTGNKAFIAEIMKGEYKDWAAFIIRQVTGSALRDFALKASTAMEIDGECVFYADRDRWTARED